MKAEEIADAATDERRALFADAYRQMEQKIPVPMIEKDFWVSYVLERIFAEPSFDELLATLAEIERDVNVLA